MKRCSPSESDLSASHRAAARRTAGAELPASRQMQDCDTTLDYLQATVILGLKGSDLVDGFAELLE